MRSNSTRCAVLLGLFALLAAAGAASEVAYTVSLDSPEQHLVEVQIMLAAGPAVRELQLPVWNALYQIRNFAQFVNWIRAKDRAGNPLAIRQISASRWRLAGTTEGAVVEYQMYVDSFGPFGAQLNSQHAFLNLAQILMYPIDARSAPMTIRFSHLPPGWNIATPLQARSDAYGATDYDRLVDSPVEISNFRQYDFDETGAHFRVIIDADPTDYDPVKIVANLREIVDAAVSWMKDRPFDTYTFFYHFPHGPAGGGMEHAYSTAIDLNAATIQRSLYPLNSVTAHEFFHLWNVKRIRPQSLEPIDYGKENCTRALWFSEGVTSTAEEIIQFRAGLIDEKQFLSHMGEEISELENRPAHLTQSAEDSSLDAWLEGLDYYRRPERSISYYNKGELLGFLLDLAIRNASQDQASLRELFQWMNANYAQKGHYFDDSNGVREAAEAVSHADLAWFFTKYVAGIEEIPWNDFLRYVGLRVNQFTVTVPDPGFIASQNFDGPIAVIAVRPGGDAERAGLQVGDIITEIQGKPATEESDRQLAQMNPGDILSIKIRSQGSERELHWKLAGRQEASYQLKDLDQVTPEQRVHRAAWLKGEANNTAGSNSRPGPAARTNGVNK